MLRIGRQAALRSSSHTLSPSPSPFLFAVRTTSSSSSSSTGQRSPLLPSQSDIWVLPFQQTPNLALQRMRIFSSATAKSVQGIISQLSKSMLGFSVVPNPVELLRWKAVYLPAWIWKARVKGTAKRDASPGGNAPPDQVKPNAMITINFGKGPLVSRQVLPDGRTGAPDLPEEVTGSIELKENFFPGTSFSPVSYISLSVFEQIDQSLDSDVRKWDPQHVPDVFSAADLEEMGCETIPALPFDMSPLAIPEVLKRRSNIQSLPYTVSTDTIEWEKLEATPIYLPFYLAHFKYEDREFSLALAATDEDIGHCDIHFPAPDKTERTFQWPSKPLGSALHPGQGRFNPLGLMSQPPFLGPIDMDQFESPKKAVEDKESSEDDSAGPDIEAILLETSLLALTMNLRQEADRWLDSDGVRGRITQASINARGGEWGGVGKIVPFERKDFDEEDEYE